MGVGENAGSVRPLPAERREPLRRRVLYGGVVTCPGAHYYFSCKIRDLSEAGARIELPREQLLDPKVFLINIRGCVAYEAEVLWNTKGQAGLKFSAAIPLEDLTDPKLTYLKELWRAHASHRCT